MGTPRFANPSANQKNTVEAEVPWLAITAALSLKSRWWRSHSLHPRATWPKQACYRGGGTAYQEKKSPMGGEQESSSLVILLNLLTNTPSENETALVQFSGLLTLSWRWSVMPLHPGEALGEMSPSLDPWSFHKSPLVLANPTNYCYTSCLRTGVLSMWVITPWRSIDPFTGVT